MPEGVLAQRPNARELLTEAQQDSLRTIADSHLKVATRAFERWARTMRWKTRSWRLGREELEVIRSGWGCHLRQAGTRNRVWVYHPPFIIYATPTVTLTQWTTAEAALAKGEESPVFVDLLLDAEMHLHSRDVRRATVDAAVAAETYIRAVVQRSLPSDTGEKVRDLIDQANIRPVMGKLYPEALDKLSPLKPDPHTLKTVHQLLDVRNKVVHLGDVAGVDAAKCRKYVDAVRRLLADEWDCN